MTKGEGGILNWKEEVRGTLGTHYALKHLERFLIGKPKKVQKAKFWSFGLQSLIVYAPTSYQGDAGMRCTHKLVSGVGWLPTRTLGKLGVPQQKCVILGNAYYRLVKVN